MISRKLLTVFVVAGGIAAVLMVQTVFSGRWNSVQVKPQRLKGDLAAEVIVLEFTDFQCPACAQAALMVEKIVRQNPGKLAVEHKYFPLSSHKNSLPAALFAECALRQGYFWPAHDLIFRTQSQWQGLADPWPFFMSRAQSLGLDVQQIEECSRDPESLRVIEADMNEGKRRGVRATPTFIVHDELAVGLDDLRQKINLEGDLKSGR
jgi:protein-disulfide isomerase